MKSRNLISKALIYLSLLLMLSLISCEKQECKICEDGNGDTMEVCTDGGELVAYSLGYYNCHY